MNDFKILRRGKSALGTPISSSIFQIKIDEIRPNPSQPRADFDNNSIIRLADSIRRYGILQPLTVRKLDIEGGYSYELIAGERRLRAARLLGYFTVPCIIVEADEKMSAEMAIIENLLREDLTMFEQAYGFKQLIESYSMTQEEVAHRMSLSQSAVANKLRLLKLTYVEQKIILESGLTERHARALLKINDVDQRLEVIKHIASAKLNVVNTEQYIENLLNKTLNENASSDSSQKEQNEEKAMNDMLQSLQKKVDLLKKSGKNATMSVLTSENEIDVHIKINKAQ